MVVIIFFSVFFCLVPFFGSSESVLLTNEFAVHIPGPKELADHVALKYGFLNKGQVGSLSGYYRFIHDRIQKRSTETSAYHASLLKNDSLVHWHEQQVIKTRVKRSSVKNFSSFVDPLYPEQWFLHADDGGYDMNTQPAWERGFTGKGVVVSILDDGIQGNHPDLAANYDREASLDINEDDDDPSPKDDNNNKHGTRCAGEVAAVANNEFCGVGVAYNAKIGGVRMLDGRVTDTIEATALSLKPNHIHIYSASWGPEDNGKTVDGPGVLAKLAFEDGIRKGRNGLGSIYVWASGNGGRLSDNCNCDGYTNSIYTISISSATEGGYKPWYLEECASTLATTYSSGTTTDRNIVTVDVDYAYFEDLKLRKKPNKLNLCTKKHTGTSASAPIAAGLCALALEANPYLTWRDMQYIIVLTSRFTPLSKEDGWITNGASRKVSTKFGYGLMDGDAMVRAAFNWKNLLAQHICSTPPDETTRIIPRRIGERVIASIYTDGCQNSKNVVKYAEHVQVRVTLSFFPRGNLQIIIVSPKNTTSSILLPRPHDSVLDQDSFDNWPFMSVHFWGEEIKGWWKLIIFNDGESHSKLAGTLSNWSITFYGTEDLPDCVKGNSCTEDKGNIHPYHDHTNPIRGISDLPDISSDECKSNKMFLFLSNKDHNTCVVVCPAGFYGDTKDYICKKCDESCHTCYGPSYNNCLFCEASFLLNSICIKHCPEGYFAYLASDPSYTNQCIPCATSCIKCKESIHQCVLCKEGFFLYEGTCLPYCPSGTYAFENKVCMKCSKECQICFGPSSNECLGCSNGYYLWDKSCVVECPKENYYVNDENRCVKCHRSCESCNSQNHCIMCDRKKYWIGDSPGTCKIQGCSPKFDDSIESYPTNPCFCDLLEGCQSCIEQEFCDICNQKYVWSSGRCYETCPNSTYLSHDECKQCLGKCLACKNNPYHCITCQDEFYLHETLCVPYCPEGYYGTQSKRCKKCHYSCKECYGPGKNKCLSCSPEKYLFNNSCIFSCPLGYYSLSHDYYLQNKILQECYPCHPTCKTCTGYGPYFCTSCYLDRLLTEYACIPCLDGNFFNYEKKVCEKCHETCGTCFGPSHEQCSSCLAPLRLDKQRHVCTPCCPSDIQPTTNCCICSSDLDFCIGRNPNGKNLNTTINLPQATFSQQLASIAITISVMAFVGFFILFGILQCRSSESFHLFSRGRDYLPVPREMNAMFNADQEKVSLTQEDAEDEDDLFLKT